jgi:hypothetical protein
VDFSEAEDLFVIIFQILDRTGKIRDRGLISKKHRGFFAKFSNNPNNELISNG